ncbi:MAG TPA: glycosyltransferase family 4 protein, partial [Candidatus Binatia bacterium]|nr:glycosyltransferase family 4 protein [Candidatus Binatia bacterium]
QTAAVAAMITLHRWLRTWQRQVNLYIALTDFCRRKFMQGGLPAEKIVVKPNFVGPDPGERDGVGRYALFVGRLSAEKGIWILLRAWQRLSNTVLKIVGDGPQRHAMQAFVDTEGVQRIELLGQQPSEDVLKLMKGAQFLIFPSEWYETFGRVAIEAFACGVPVIASRLGAIAEIVEDGHTGLLFQPGDLDDLAAKVRWAVSHPEEMTRMGTKARQVYEIKYTPEANYRMLCDIYKRAINNAKGAIRQNVDTVTS